jgi:hypothetical protein
MRDARAFHQALLAKGAQFTIESASSPGAMFAANLRGPWASAFGPEQRIAKGSGELRPATS